MPFFPPERQALVGASSIPLCQPPTRPIQDSRNDRKRFARHRPVLVLERWWDWPRRNLAK